MMVSRWSWRDRAAVLAGLAIPIGVCGLLVPFRSSIANTDAALILVAAVVAVAAYGHRIAGVVASVSAAAAFDFFLTAPYERLTIADRVDAETFLLLLVVGVAVTELAVRGRRSRLLAISDERLLRAIESTGALVESNAAQSELTAHVAAQVTTLLGLRSCRFEANRFGGLPRLEPDGRVRVGNRYWDVDQYGLPDQEIEILASMHGHFHGRFVLSPIAGVIPTQASRRCATIVVGQAAAALASDRQTV